MTKDEKLTLQLVEQYYSDPSRDYQQSRKAEDALKILMAKGLGKSSPEFVEKLVCYKKKFEEKYYSGFQRASLWITLEDYLVSTATSPQNTAEKVISIETTLKDIKNDSSDNAGQGMPKRYIADSSLVKQVYLTEDEALIKLFSSYIPVPPSHVFEGHDLPQYIKDRENQKREAIDAFKKHNKGNITAAVNALVRIQRRFRGKQRQKEELNRILWRHKMIKDPLFFNGIIAKTETEARKNIADANTPYRPQKCSKEIADRIVNAAKKVELFTTIRHFTATNTIENVLDTALFGQRTLLQTYTNFRRAALFFCDIENGDGNVICFAPNNIDGECFKKSTTEIKLDLTKLIDKNKIDPNPCIFYKQRDFGLISKNPSNISIGNETLSFIHTMSAQLRSNTPLALLDENRTIKFYTELPNNLFMSYNLNDIHQILTLNFFRFIDNLRIHYNDEATDEINRIYHLISQLTEDELAEFLTDLGKKMTDTCEFNFYGAYRIDFDLVTTFEDCDNGFVLDLRKFIEELNKGNIDKYTEACEKLPNVFQSERLIDYLIKATQNKDSLEVLSEHLASIQNPENTRSFAGP